MQNNPQHNITENLFCWPCIFLLGCAKGILACIPSAVCCTLIITYEVLTHFPFLTWKLLNAISRCPRFGINYRILFILLAILGLALFIPLSIFVCLVGSILLPFGSMIGYTFAQPNFKSGFDLVEKGCRVVITDTRNFLNHTANEVIDTIRRPLRVEEEVMEIHFIQMLASILGGIISGLLCFICSFLLGFIKFIPFLWKSIYFLFFWHPGDNGHSNDCGCFVLRIFLFPLIITIWAISVILYVVFLVMAIVGYFFFGIVYSAKEFIESNHCRNSIVNAWKSLELIDGASNEFLGIPGASLLPWSCMRSLVLSCCSFHRESEHLLDAPPEEPQLRRSMSSIDRLRGKVDVGLLLDSFFERCKVDACDLIEKNLFSVNEFQDMEPSIFISVPAIVVFHALKRSADANSKGIMFANGIELTHDNHPEIMHNFWKPCQKLKEKIKSVKLTDDEVIFVEYFLANKADEERNTAPLGKRRKSKITTIASDATGIAISVSRLPPFRRRFEEVIDHVLSEYNVSVSDSSRRCQIS